MGVGTASTPSSGRKPRKARIRRASAAGSAQKLRDRALWESIQMTVMLDEAGMLGNLKPGDSNYEEDTGRELAVKLQTSLAGAKRILKLTSLASNEDAWQFVKSHSMLGVFTDSHFTKGYSSIKSGGGTLSTEFLEAFMNGPDVKSHEQKLTERARTRSLDSLSLSFTAEGRDLLVSLFFKLVAPIATLCSYVSPETGLDKIKLLDLTGRYLGDQWTSESMQREYQTRANLMCLVDGWNLVNEAMKVQVQELNFRKGFRQSEKSESGSDSHEEPGKWKVNAEEVRAKVFEMCCHVVSEFFAWCFQFSMRNEEVGPFMDSVLETMDNICLKVSDEVGVVANEDDEVSETVVKASLQSVADGHPTMAEIKYDAKEMYPSKREARLNASKRDIVWKPCDVLMRCRWENSPAREAYSSYLSKAIVETIIAAQKVVDSPPPAIVDLGSSASVVNDISEIVSGTPEQNPPVFPRKREFAEMIGHGADDGETRGPSYKKARDVLLHTSRRLYDSAVKDRIERGKRLQQGYVDDGEVSGDERVRQEIEEQTEEDMVHATNLSVQLLYEQILDWPVLPVSRKEIEKDRHRLLPTFDPNNPVTKAERSAVSDLMFSDLRWAKTYCASRSRSFVRDITQAKAVEEYAAHWRNIIPIEIRAMVSDNIGVMFPKHRENPDSEWSSEVRKEQFVLLRVHSVALEKGVINTTCKSLQPNLNKEIATKLQGGTICLGYTEGYRDVKDDRGRRVREKRYSNPILFICRRVHRKNDDVMPLGDTEIIDELEVHIAVGRERTKHVLGIWDQDLFRVIPLCPLSPHLRMFKAVHEVYRLPEKLRDVVFGHRCPSVPSTSDMERLVDPGCQEYLKRLRQSPGLIDDPQLAALNMVLGNVGKGEANSSSLSLIQGPPGTGKTTVLTVLIGALLHHSICGHIGRAEIHELKDQLPEDGILRHSTNSESFRILVCCSSNQAVDNILRRIHKKGIPDGQGGTIRPQCVRLAKQGHGYAELKKYSMDVKALPFDKFLYNKNQPMRKCASSKARKSFAKEVILAFATHSSCGGARVKNLKVGWDIILVDEACQSWEPETLIPMTTAMKRSSLHRCHVVCSGDPSQLDPLFLAEMMMRKARPQIDYQAQMKSMFERIQGKNRAAFVMLTNQYRMHPVISCMHSAIFYNGAVRSPTPANFFQERYNLAWDDATRSFAPVTLIDTSNLPMKFESNDQKGSVSNCVELDIIDEVLSDIKRVAGDRFESLRNQIAVLTPYKAQVRRAKDVLSRYGKYHEHGGVSRQGFQILIGTVDAMQGEQRDIIIFAATRSNPEQSLGFVDRPNRLNVAVSRSSKLLVIIADMSTLSASGEFRRFRNYAGDSSSGGALIARKTDKNSGDTGKSVVVRLNSA